MLWVGADGSVLTEVDIKAALIDRLDAKAWVRLLLVFEMRPARGMSDACAGNELCMCQEGLARFAEKTVIHRKAWA